MEQRIKINSPQECSDIFEKIMNNDFNEKDKKYASYVSMAYFVKNLHLFPKNKVDEILNHPELSKAISSKLSYELLENAINNKKIFISYSKKWFHNVKANQELLNQYLELLLESNDNKQIEDFCNANPELAKKHYKIYGSRMTPNHTFELYVIGNNPELIKNSRSLNENEMMELFNKGLIKYEHVMTCFDRFSYGNQSIIANEVTQFFIKTNYDELNKEEKKLYLEKFAMNSCFFIRKLQELNSLLLNELLNKDGTSTLGTHPKTTLNVLQSLVKYETIKTESRNVNKLINICLNEYKDVFLSDVTQKTGYIEFEKKENYLQYLFQEKQYEILISLSYFNEKFSNNQKELLLAANLNSIFEDYQNSKTRSVEFNAKKHIKPLLNFEESLFKSYLDKIKKIEDIDKDLINEIEKVILHNKLEITLQEKPVEKKLKI